MLFAAYGPGAVRAVPRDRLALLAFALAVGCVLGLLRRPGTHPAGVPRIAPESDRIRLLVPVVLAVLAIGGWTWAAACALAAYLVRPSRMRRFRLAERVLGAALIVPAWWAGALVAPVLRRLAESSPSLTVAALFAGVGSGFVFLQELVWLDGLVALRTARSPLAVLRDRLRDLRAFPVLAEAAWAYVIARLALSDGPGFAAATLAPVVAFAVLLARYAWVQARLHRLAVSREAVDAMLRARDPEPQVRSLLESVDPRIVREAVEIAAFGRSGTDRWSRVVRFGPTVDSALQRLGGRVLLELQATGDESACVEAEAGIARAFAARDADGRLRGALVVFRPRAGAALVAERELERAAAEIAPLLREYGEIAATRTAAATDTLTGLANRRGFGRTLDEAMEQVRRGARCAVLLIDVDHFKAINDLLGHQTGDRVLARIARIVAENVRGIDAAGRFGGEEFIVLLRDASRERTVAIAERLRAAIEGEGLAHADGRPVTVSVGVAYARPVDGADDVIERADRALYRAKSAGRNRVVESTLVAV